MQEWLATGHVNQIYIWERPVNIYIEIMSGYNFASSYVAIR